jgi:hypothetical protein
MPRKQSNDPIERWREIGDHRYDPGYWTGGRLDPTLTAKRPNRGGYVSIIGGLVAITVAVVLLVRGEWMLIYPIAVGLGFGLVSVVAGLRMLRAPRA